MAGNDELQVGWTTGEERRPVMLPLATVHRHALVTGTTGYGKSGFLLALMLGLLTRRTGTGMVLVDPKGETVAWLRDEFLPTLADRLPGIVPERVVAVAPFGAWGVPLNPCARIAGLPVEVQAHHVGTLVAGMVDGVGPRMASLLGWLLRAVIETGGSLLDVRRLLVEESAGATLAGRVRDEEVRDYFLRVLPTESRTTKDALRARIEHLVLLPCLRAMLCAKGSLSGSALIEAPVTLVDLAGSPMGMEATARFAGGWIFTLLASAALTRNVTEKTHPVLLCIDEWHRLVSAEADLERLLSQVRHRKVGLLLANQDLGQLAAMSPMVLSSLLTNVSTQVLFRPKSEDLRSIDDLLPVTGRKVDPDAPDRLLSRDEEKRRYKAMLAKLPPREALLVDRIAGTTHVIRTLSLPFEEAHERAARLPAVVREAWQRGRFGVPMGELLAAVRPSETGPSAAPAPTQAVDDETAVAPAAETPPRRRKREQRLRLVVP